MPTYVYQCSTCDKTFEVEQRITEDALKDCQCGSKDSLKRLIQPIAVMFKGAGFHINDYSSPGAKTESAGETKAECSGEPKSCPACSPATESSSS